MEEGWLAGNAVVAFVGALLTARSLQLADRSYELPFGATIPALPDVVLLSIIAFLAMLSFFLAMASVVPIVRHWAIRHAYPLSPMLDYLILVAFFLSWLEAAQILPLSEWWGLVLFWGGALLIAFNTFRITLLGPMVRLLDRTFRKPHMHEPTGDGEADDLEQSEAPARISLIDRLRGLRACIRLPDSSSFWITMSLSIAVAEVCLAIVLWDWLGGGESPSTTIRNIGLVIAGSVAFPLAVWRALVADRQASASQDQSATAQQGLLQERYQRASEMLGNGVLSARLGGIYALRHLVLQHPVQYHVQTMQLFCAFARNPTEDGELVRERRMSDLHFPMLRDDIQAVLSSISDRGHTGITLEKAAGFRLTLQYANLRGAIMNGADLGGAFLWGADLSGAYLANTRFESAILSDVNLSGTHFSNEGESPATGLIQCQLDKALADPKELPKLCGVRDAETGKQIEWNGKPLVGDEQE